MTPINMRVKKYTPAVLAYSARYLILCCFAYVLVYPFIFMAINSVKNPIDWFDPTVNWVPKAISFDNFRASINFLDYWKALGSTMLNGIIPAIVSFFTCAVAGYGLARFNFKGKNLLNTIMIICIMIPDPLIMIPSYDNFRHLDIMGIFNLIYKLTGADLRISIINTPLVFIVPAVLATGLKNGLFIYIYSQFFKGLPKELEEAAWIDGAGPWKTFLNIVLPSSGASSVTVLVFAIVWYWNDYYQAQIYLSENFPLSVALANFTANQSFIAELSTKFSFTTGSLLLTCCFVSVIPLLLFFLFMQRKFVQSIATCGIVG